MTYGVDGSAVNAMMQCSVLCSFEGSWHAVLPDREQSSQICELFTLYMNFF